VQADVFWSAYGIRGAVAYYPYCDSVADRNIAIPLLVLMGEKDDWTPAERCKALLANGVKQPALVEPVYYPDTYHSFDREGVRVCVQGIGIGGKIESRRIEYNATSARDAEHRTRGFFERLLRTP